VCEAAAPAEAPPHLDVHEPRVSHTVPSALDVGVVLQHQLAVCFFDLLLVCRLGDA
jgi:hypothetical protein